MGQQGAAIATRLSRCAARARAGCAWTSGAHGDDPRPRHLRCACSSSAAIRSALRAALHPEVQPAMSCAPTCWRCAAARSTKDTTNPLGHQAEGPRRAGRYRVHRAVPDAAPRAHEHPAVVRIVRRGARAAALGWHPRRRRLRRSLRRSLTTFKSVLQATHVPRHQASPLPGCMSSAFASCLPAMIGESNLNTVRSAAHSPPGGRHGDAFDQLTAA